MIIFIEAIRNRGPKRIDWKGHGSCNLEMVFYRAK